MSTPTINTAATQGLARVVTNLENQVHETRRPVGPPALHEVTQLAETMRVFADADVMPVLDRLWSAAEAIDKAEAQIVSPHTDTSDLLDADPEVITQRVLDSCRDRATREALAYQNAQHFRDALARHAGVALRDAADTVVKRLRDDFDKHAKVIRAAVKAGLSEHTDTTDLLATGTPAQITAFRALPDAVAGLEQVASLRNQMADLLGYGPSEPRVLSFVTGLTSPTEAAGAIARYEDAVETVQYNQEFTGSAMVQVRVQRLGGRWLALAISGSASGYELHLNTAAETEALHRAVQGVA